MRRHTGHRTLAAHFTDSDRVSPTKRAAVQPCGRACVCHLRGCWRITVELIGPPSISKPRRDVNKPDLPAMLNWHCCLDNIRFRWGSRLVCSLVFMVFGAQGRGKHGGGGVVAGNHLIFLTLTVSSGAGSGLSGCTPPPASCLTQGNHFCCFRPLYVQNWSSIC